MTRTADPSDVAEATAFLSLPVVSLAQARGTLRRPRDPQQGVKPPEAVRPALTIGNVVLGAFLEALFDTGPVFGAAIIDTLEEAALAAQLRDPGGDHAAVAFAALAWLHDLRGPVLDQGEA